MAQLTSLDGPYPGTTEFGSALLALRPTLQRLAIRLTHDRTDAEDLVQDTLIRAWAARTRFQAGTNTKAWLLRIARNSFLSGLRRTRRHIDWDPDRHPAMLRDVATQDEALYGRDLQVALARLPAAQREAFLLIAQQGETMAEAALTLGVPVGTVKSRISRARASILAYVADGSEAAKEQPAASAKPATATDADADQGKASRYATWKASGATTIG